MNNQTKNFMELANDNPCEGCPAPCCQMQVMPWVPPRSLMSVDHIRFSLLFPDTEMIVSSTGEFSLVKWSTCSLFNEKTCRCSVHSTPKQPLTCVHFNPYQCWYKRNFVTDGPSPDVYRLNTERYEVWVKKIEFDEDNNVVAFPSFQEAQEMLKDIPLERTFKRNRALIKRDDQVQAIA
jgi:Fe-S-cluster containining protein